MSPIDLANLRTDYSRQALDESSVSPDPYVQFGDWMKEALDAGSIEPSAMNVATVDAEGRPSSRIVLLKGFDPTGFVFFTNYDSRKGRQLDSSPFTVLHFFWPELERQVNISGKANRVSREESEEYYASRPLESRIGAWASKQSSVISGRRELERSVEEVRHRFGDDEIPCPPFWGGYRVTPDRFEFWQGRPSRLHDRICYDLENGNWQISRLSP